jgi:RHS repeat-associated protein
MRAARFLFLAFCGWDATAQTTITLSPTTSPSAGQPGVTSINVTGSNFPTGSILPASTNVTLNPASGTGASAMTAATAVTTIVGTTRRVTFTIPSSLNVSTPTAYLVSITGSTTTGTAFASSNQSSLTVNPGAAISVNPNTGQQGQQNLLVTITGQLTNFVPGATQASVGAGISVGGAAAGTLGPVMVLNSTTATVSLNIALDAAPGTRTVTVQTAGQQASLNSGFTVTAGAPSISQVNPASGQQGQVLTGVVITGAFTHFTLAAPTITFSNTGVTASSVQVIDNTHLTATLTIASSATTGGSNVTVLTGTEMAMGTGLFTVGSGGLTITQVNPASGQQGQTLTGVVITGAFTHFTQATPTITFSNAGVAASGVQVIDNTHLTVTLTIAANAATGASNVAVVTGMETATGTGLFTVAAGTPVITSVSPASGQQGKTLTGVVMTGSFTHFTQATPSITFSTAGVTASLVQVTDNTHLTVAVTITATAATGASNVTVVTGAETASGGGLFTVTALTPIITRVNPNVGQPGQQNLLVAITGQSTHFVQNTTTTNFGTGVTVNSTSVTDATDAVANITIAGSAAQGPRTVIITTGTEAAALANGFTVTPGVQPTITDFNPKSAPIGTVVTVTGTNLQPNAGTSAQVTLAQQGGGTLMAPVSSTTPASLSFVIPAGAATGPLSVTVNGQSTTTTVQLTIVPASTFTLSALPNPANVIQGQSTAYAVGLTSNSDFNQLATLGVTGMPSGVTAAFKPQQITAGQTSVLTVSTPSGQALSSSTLTLTASALVSGTSVVQSIPLTLNVQPVTTSFLGRTVVSDSLETPLASVKVTMLGKDGNGNTTGCTGSTLSDGGGNFSLTNLSPMCVGPQLISFDGTTATNPAGKYAGVNLVFTFSSGQVTVSPVLVHLPRIDNQETFLVQQNAGSDQGHSFSSIPGLAVTVYAGTTFIMPDGTQPNPFPLTAVQVPVDRLPDSKPTVPTMMMVFIVAFQPANATASQPVAVTYPNPINTPPGTNMVFMTLDPTHGQMVPYGTGTVSANGTQIVPDADPAHPGHLYGLVHFDWHGPMPPASPAVNPSPATGGTGNGPGSTCVGNDDQTDDDCIIPCLCQIGAGPLTGDPVDLGSGLYVSNKTDMVLSSGRGRVAIHRIYRTLSTIDGPFGIGSGHNYNYQLDVASVSSAQSINLINPDGGRFPFGRQSNGTVINPTIPKLQGSVMTTGPGDQANLRYKNGTVIVFQRFGILSLEVSVTDVNGNKITINRNPSNPQQILSIADPVGRQLIFTYDSQNPIHIASITDPIGRVVRYTYNFSGTLASVTDPAGGVTNYFYDSQNRLQTVVDPRGVTVLQNAFDSNGRVSQQTQADGNVIFIGYELANATAQTSFIRDVSSTDSLGRGYFYRFNPQGFVIQANDGLGQSTAFNRDPGSNLVLSTTGNATCPVCGPVHIGNLSFTYDANGNLLSKTDALGNRTTYTYDPVFSKVASITDPLGNVSRFAYDANGNLLARTDANNNQSSYQYDSTGLLIQATDALNQKTKLAYDAFGNLITITDPLGNTTSYLYDAISRLVATKDSLGRQTTFTYDSLNRLLTRTDAKSGVTGFAYDVNGNLLSVVDARNNSTAFSYDAMNRIAATTNALGKADSRMYDFDGNVIQFVDRRGQTSTFTYDNLNRLITESYSDATVSRSYDARGRLSQVSDSASGTFIFSYDSVGHLMSSSTPVGSINYAYDARGAMTSRQVAGQPALSYAYDPVGNLASAAMPHASADFAYNPRSQLSRISRLNGVSTAYTYDADARLLTLTHTMGGSIIDAENYTYDAVGSPNSHSSTISQPLITLSTTNQYDVANKLIQFGSVPDSYDDNGNLIQEGTTNAYTWDSRNRLKSIVAATGQTTTFTYDFAHNLIGQADNGTSLNLKKYFVLDTLTNVAYGSRSDGTAFSVLSGRSIDSHLAIYQSSGQVLYGLSDAINSTVAAVDQTGVTKSQFFYDAYGQTTPTGSYPFQFTGRVPVSASLYYYRTRFYSPTMGRFISADPLGFGGGDVNVYRYVSNNPISFVDPLGLDTVLPTNVVKQLWGCGSASYNFATTCMTSAQQFPADLSNNQAQNTNPLLNLDSGDPNAAYNLQQSLSQVQNGVNNGGDLGANQLITGLNGPPGQDLWQCAKATYNFAKACYCSK